MGFRDLRNPSRRKTFFEREFCSVNTMQSRMLMCQIHLVSVGSQSFGVLISVKITLVSVAKFYSMVAVSLSSLYGSQVRDG